MKSCLKQTIRQLAENDKLLKDTRIATDHHQWPMKTYLVKLITAHTMSMPTPNVSENAHVQTTQAHHTYIPNLPS